MRVMVTGGAGFIGSHVADAAVTAGHDVLVVDDLSNGHRENVPAGADLEIVDIRDEQAVHRVFDAFEPQAVSHHAAQASVSISVKDPKLDAEINILGSIYLLEAARRHGARILFASTGGALYGEVPEGERATTSWPTNPLSPYACSKAAFEHYLRAYQKAHGLAFTILRYGNVFGPRQDPHGEAGVVAIFANRLLAGDSIQVNAKRDQGDDGCIRDYVYVADVVRANLLAIDGQLDGQTLNVGTGMGTDTRTLAASLCRLLDKEDAEILDGAFRAGDLERSVLDPGNLTSLIGKMTSLEDGLAQTATWFQQRNKRND